MKIKKDELLWIFLNKVPVRFLNIEESGEKTVKSVPERFLKPAEKYERQAVKRAIQDHRVPIRFIK